MPWARAPLAALSSPVTIVVAVVTGLVVAFVVASSVFHVSASGSAAVQYVTGSRCADETGVSIERGGRGFFARPLPDALGGLMPKLAESAERNGLDLVRRTRYGSRLPMTIDGQVADGRLAARDGAMEHATPVAGGGTDGAWIPSELADELGVGVGASLVVATEPGDLRLPVTAVYATITDPVGEYWCSQRSELIRLVGVPERAIRPATVLVAPEVLDRLVEDGLPVQIDRVQITSTTPPADRASAVRHAAATAAVVADFETLFAPAAHSGPIAGVDVSVGNRAEYPADSGARAQRAVGGSLVPLTGVSLLVGLAAVAGLAGQWLQRRFAEVRLLWTRGASPAALGGKAVLELAAPLAVGAALGWLVARAGVPLLAPAAELDGWAAPVAGVAAGLAWLVCLAVLAVAATVRVRRQFQPASAGSAGSAGSATRAGGAGRGRRLLRLLPWELIAAGLAVWSWRRLSGGALVVSRSDLLPRVDVLALMFPLLCLAVLTGVVTRLGGLALRAGHRVRGWRWPAVLWAARRAAAQGRLTVALLAVAGLAVGVVAVGVGVSDTQRQAVLDKGRLFIGSDTAVRLLSSRDVVEVPPALRGSATRIGVRDADVGGATARVLAIDPATVADGMPWRPEWGGGAELSELVSRLGPAGPDGAVPVLAFGPVDPERFKPAGIERVRVVGTVDTFPAREHAQAMLVMSWDGLAGGDQRGFTRYVLSRGAPEPVVRELEAAGELTGWAYTAAGANDALPFLVVAWTFDFFVTLGAVLALVAVAALLVAIEARRRATAVAHALLARMGLRASGLYGSYVAELAGLAVVAAALGLAGGWLVLATASARLDPAPWLSPTPVPIGLWPLAALVAGVAAAAVVLVAALATRAAVTAPVRELLRGGAA